MTLRGLKKRERRAVRKLVKKHGYRRSDFNRSDGTETLYAPSNLKSNRVEFGRFVSPLIGTLLYWYTSDYYSGEQDVKFPSDVLDEVEFDWDAEARRQG